MDMLNMRQHCGDANTHAVILPQASTAIVQDLQQMSRSVALQIPAHPKTGGLVHEDSRRLSTTPSKRSSRQLWTSVRTKRLMLLQSRLLGRAIELVQLNTCGAWTYGFRTYNLRPYDAPIWRHVRESNVGALQELFQTRQASILDRDPQGLTLLHVGEIQDSSNQSLCLLS